jgi:hypothetical protein
MLQKSSSYKNLWSSFVEKKSKIEEIMKMKKLIIRVTILALIAFALSATAPITKVTYAEFVCIEGTEPGCPPDDGSGSNQGPKQPPPPKEVSWYCRWFKVACPAS